MPWIAGPMTPGWSRSGIRAWTTSGRDILKFYPRTKAAARRRLPDEPGADPQPGPVGGEPGVPPHRRGRERGLPGRRDRLGAGGRPGHQPADGLPDGGRPLAGEDVGRLAQARGGRRRPGDDGDSPQRHPPQVRQLHPAGDGPHRGGSHRIRPAHRLQPVRVLQALRGGVPGRGHFAGRPVRPGLVLHAQLPGVHGRVRRLGRTRRRLQGAAWTSARKSPGKRPSRPGRASPSARITRRRTACPSARPGRT